jgi:hypothetical protein
MVDFNLMVFAKIKKKTQKSQIQKKEILFLSKIKLSYTNIQKRKVLCRSSGFIKIL